MNAGAPPDGNARRTQRTVERILAESLRLFNERGEANVTTGMIAVELDMSPGNLYYHFPNKERIVEALFRRFESRIDVDPPVSTDAARAIEDLWLYLHLMFEAIWEFRFLYRNLDDLAARNRRLRDHLNRIFDRKARAVTALFDTLVAAGAMQANAEEKRALARNVLLVATYWLNFHSLRDRRDAHAAEGLGLGAYQVLSLVAPYLRGQARAHLHALSRRYIE
jgi:AcrR family transcriptional regulator